MKWTLDQILSDISIKPKYAFWRLSGYQNYALIEKRDLYIKIWTEN